jgi:uncharacterized protein (DUF1800 family)
MNPSRIDLRFMFKDPLSLVRSFFALLLACVLFVSPGLEVAAAAVPASAVSAVAAPEADKKPKQDPVLKGLPISDLTIDEAILHALNRLAYGPRPGDVDRIKQIGLSKWIDQQLNPNSIDDRAVEARLETLPTLRLSTVKLIEEYPRPKQAAKQAGVTGQEFKRQQEQSSAGTSAGVNAPSSESSADSMSPSSASGGGMTPERSGTDTDAPSPMKQAPGNVATPGASQRGALSVDPNAVPRAIADDSKRPQRIVEELAMAKMTRAIYSDRQLQQVMDDFWFNHFNVFAGKGEDRYYLTSYERDVIQLTRSASSKTW